MDSAQQPPPIGDDCESSTFSKAHLGHHRPFVARKTKADFLADEGADKQSSREREGGDHAHRGRALQYTEVARMMLSFRRAISR